MYTEYIKIFEHLEDEEMICFAELFERKAKILSDEILKKHKKYNENINKLSLINIKTDHITKETLSCVHNFNLSSFNNLEKYIENIKINCQKIYDKSNNIEFQLSNYLEDSIRYMRENFSEEIKDYLGNNNNIIQILTKESEEYDFQINYDYDLFSYFFEFEDVVYYAPNLIVLDRYILNVYEEIFQEDF